MRRTICHFVSLLLATSAIGARARAADSTGAVRAKEGYALKQAGNCRDAVRHFARSLQLDPTPKVLLNLADCEQSLGDPVVAHDHAVQGRALAIQRSDGELAAVANEQIARLTKGSRSSPSSSRWERRSRP